METTLETGGKDVETTLETSGKDVKFTLGTSVLGVPWTSSSYIKLVGFFFMIFGSLVYNGTVCLPLMQ